MAKPAAGRRPGGVGAEPTYSEEIADALGALFLSVREHFERVVEPFDLPGPCAKALWLIEGSISMKELGSRIHCDGSFVTAIADTLEGRGLALRKIDANDRRIKNLVLTPKGAELRERLGRELFSDEFPGLRNLSGAQRQTFLSLLQKMVPAAGGGIGTAGGPGCAA